jgi:hypothetical protein
VQSSEFGGPVGIMLADGVSTPAYYIILPRLGPEAENPRRDEPEVGLWEVGEPREVEKSSLLHKTFGL